jgi:hypothetical protein
MQRTECCLLGVLLLAATGAGDRPAAAARVGAPRAAVVANPASAALPRFALFGWVSPPKAQASAERYAELAGAGFDVTVLAWEDSGLVADNRARLGWTRPLGVRNLLYDADLVKLESGAEDSLRWADSVAVRYRDDPAFLGYYLGDEPRREEFARNARLFALLRERDPAHPGWNNLPGRVAFATREQYLEYTRDYVAQVAPAVLCNDHYDFRTDGDARQFVENVAGLAAIARENGLPFWGIVQLVEHAVFRPMTAPLLRWQVAQWLSYGARGIGYFTYWTPAPDPQWDWRPAMISYEGARTPFYDMVRALNERVRPLGEELAGLQWLATEHAGSVPPGGTPFAPDSLLDAVEGRVALGLFADSAGAPRLFVANLDSSAARTVTLTLGGIGRRAWRWRDAGGWDELTVGGDRRVALALDAGDFALLKLSGSCDGAAAGRSTLRLVAGPNPAAGAVTFALAGAQGATRLEVLDVSGRRVWGRSYAGGSAVARWDGERDGGGRATSGVYFARAEDARGVVVRRVNWLGAK